MRCCDALIYDLIRNHEKCVKNDDDDDVEEKKGLDEV